MSDITLYDLTPPGPLWFEQAPEPDDPPPPEPAGWVWMEQWGGSAGWWREGEVRTTRTEARKGPGE